MKFLIALMLVSISAIANEKVIYGEDNRHEVYNYPNQSVVNLAKSTVALMKKNSLTIDRNSGMYKIPYQTYADAFNLCGDERFLAQPTAAHCSGFLIAPNKIITAGHCIQSKVDCESTAFIFDYQMANPNQFYSAFKTVYSCKKVLGQRLDKNGIDFAVIELDQDVPRPVLALSNNQNLAKGTSVLAMGHPSGLPLKITDNARVRTVSSGIFVSNLDTFGGNSGSAVFNAGTLEVEGILVRGETDFDSGYSCRNSNRFGDNQGRGESATLITKINENGIYGDNSKLANDNKYRYIWFDWFQTCNEFYGTAFKREVEESYCPKNVAQTVNFF